MATKLKIQETRISKQVVKRPRKPVSKPKRSVPGLLGRGLVQIGNEVRLELRHLLKMARNLFGRIVNVSERTLAKVESRSEEVEKLKRPYNEVYRLYRALSEVVDTDSLPTWFSSPNKAFDGLKPIEVIERGEIDRIWDMVYQLRSGMPG
jgi:hypothetical protein